MRFAHARAAHHMLRVFCLLFLTLLLRLSPLAAQNIEDEPIPDDLAIPTQPAPSDTAAQNAASPHNHNHNHDAQEHDQSTLEAPGEAAANLDLSWPPFMYQALYAGLLVAAMCSYLGLYVVLKRIVFVGVALSELSSAGIALALFLGMSPLFGSILFTLLGVLIFSARWSPRRVPHESFIGIIYCIAGAVAILLIAKSVHGESNMLKLLQGDVLTVDPRETLQMLGAFAVVAVLHALFSKEFVFVSFDRDSAQTLGFQAGMWDLLLFFTIGIVIAFSIRATGVLLTSTMLIIPAVTALLLTKRFPLAAVIAPVCGILPLIAGLYLSYIIDVPASAVVVALSFGLLLPVLLFHTLRRAGA